MSAAAELYAVATDTERRAVAEQHERDETRRCVPWCWRCYLDARARLYGRAGDSALALET